MRVLRGLKLLLFMNCREAAPLISQSLDRRLATSDRAAVNVHLAICQSCRRFRGQLTLLRRVLILMHLAPHAFAGAPLSVEAKERLRAELERRAGGTGKDS